MTDPDGLPDGPAGAAAPLYIGSITGTSIDGLDLALLACPEGPGRLPELRAACTLDLPTTLRADLRRLARADRDHVALLGSADAALGDCIGQAVGSFLAGQGVASSAVRAIGSHGQTVRHAPGDDPAWTLQLGDPNRIAAITGIDVVADFRRADMAAGGEGAPLVPAFHAALLGGGQDRLVLNLGGIANLTWLPGDGDPSGVQGFDSGPANTLLDAWYQRHHPQGPDHDPGGAWAASGRPLPTLLDELLAEPWLAMAPPKSTGPELFNLVWLDAAIARAGCADAAPADVQATLVALTARTVADAVTRFLPDHNGALLLCGGGVHNQRLVAALDAALQGCQVQPLDRALPPVPPGCAPWGDAIEAAAFAWLAHRHLQGLPGNVPQVTGAAGPRVLGARWPAPRQTPAS